MKLALGTVQFGLDYGVANNAGRVSTETARTILVQAIERGIDTLDTAIAYGDSELVLGELGVGQWRVVTKLPSVPECCFDVVGWVEKEIQKSMARLNVRQLHGVLLHRPDQLLDGIGKDLYGGLKNIRDKGLTKKIGVSVYDPIELQQLVDSFEIDIVQAPLNILDRRLVESGWAVKLKGAGIELHTRSAFLQGLMLMSPRDRPEKFKRWSDVWNVWDNWLIEEGVSPLSACLQYLNSVDEIDRIVVGVDSVDHLRQITDVAEGILGSLPNWGRLKDSRIINPSCWSGLR